MMDLRRLSLPQIDNEGVDKHNDGSPYRYYKTTPFLSFEGKKTGSNVSIFSGTAHYMGCVKNSQKSVELHCFEFQSIHYKFKSIFPTKSL